MTDPLIPSWTPASFTMVFEPFGPGKPNRRAR
jgi:hypothetical protein